MVYCYLNTVSYCFRSCLNLLLFEEHFVACGGYNESVLVWDVRSPAKVLYEVSTGNCILKDIGYHAKSKTLLPLVECTYVDRNFTCLNF